MNKRRFSQRNQPHQYNETAARIIKLIVLTISATIFGVLSYEALTGAQPDFLQIIAIALLVVSGMWIKENKNA